MSAVASWESERGDKTVLRENTDGMTALAKLPFFLNDQTFSDFILPA